MIALGLGFGSFTARFVVLPDNSLVNNLVLLMENVDRLEKQNLLSDCFKSRYNLISSNQLYEEWVSTRVA